MPALRILLLLILITPLTSWAQQKAYQIIENSKTALQLAIQDPTEDYKNASEQSKEARRLVHYGGALHDSIPATSGEDRVTLINESINALNKALHIDSTLTSIRILLGNLFYKYRDNTDAALDCYYEQVALSPTNYDGLYNIALLNFNLQNYDTAIFYLHRASASTPIYKARANVLLSDSYGKKNDIENQIYYLEQAINNDPTDAALYYKLGTTLGKKQNDLDGAISYIRRAIALAPDVSIYYEDLSVAYGLKEEYKNAEQVLLAGIKRFPDYEPFYSNLHITYMNLHQTKKAKEYLKKAEMLKKLTFIHF